jgi:hypothetical protein
MAGKSKTGALPIPGVAEGIDLVKKVWGVAGLPMLPTPASVAQFATRLPQTLPSMIAPTLDVDELDKRIADLRAVEQWLNLNLSMLRTAVQSLEVQRNTIATLKSFGGAVLSAGVPHPAAVPAQNWPYPAGQAGVPMPAAPASMAPPVPSPTGRAARKPRARHAAASAAAALPLNPTAWWNTLQDQFTKIAAAAAAEAQAAAKAAAMEKSTGKPEPTKRPEARRRKRRAAKAA